MAPNKYFILMVFIMLTISTMVASTSWSEREKLSPAVGNNIRYGGYAYRFDDDLFKTKRPPSRMPPTPRSMRRSPPPMMHHRLRRHAPPAHLLG
ncbi:hypothetical protein ACP275_02G128500 [Erythranthe tilingii]